MWGPGYETAGGNLRVYMAKLRQKVEADPARPRHLLTEPGMGYRFQPEERESAQSRPDGLENGQGPNGSEVPSAHTTRQFRPARLGSQERSGAQGESRGEEARAETQSQTGGEEERQEGPPLTRMF